MVGLGLQLLLLLTRRSDCLGVLLGQLRLLLIPGLLDLSATR
jgi:hypothetical protein